jgi:plasmid stabilization system protein ParE
MIAAALTGLIAIVLWVGLTNTQEAERRETALKSEIERLEFNQIFLRERGQQAPEIQQQLGELRAELAEVQAERRAARQQAREEAEEIRQGIRSTYAHPKEGQE